MSPKVPSFAIIMGDFEKAIEAIKLACLSKDLSELIIGIGVP